MINIKIVIELQFVKFGRDCEHSKSDDLRHRRRNWGALGARAPKILQ